MEKEIEKLKQEYLATSLPPIFTNGGYDDVVKRINSRKPIAFYKSRTFVAIMFALLIVVSFTGLTVISTPQSSLYGVKSAVGEAFRFINPIKYKEPQQPAIKKAEDINIKITPSPTISPSPSTPTKMPFQQKNKTQGQSSNSNKKQSASNSVEVKGSATYSKPPTQRGNSEEHRNENSQNKNNSKNK